MCVHEWFTHILDWSPSMQALRTLAVEHNKRFVGSTSSLTGVLSHIYFLLSGHKPIDTSSLSKGFSPHVRYSIPVNSRGAHRTTLSSITSHSAHACLSLLDWNSNMVYMRSIQPGEGLMNTKRIIIINFCILIQFIIVSSILFNTLILS